MAQRKIKFANPGRKILLFLFGFSFILTALAFSQEKEMKYNPLTPEEEAVILNKGTERAFSGVFYDFDEKGTYTCKRCGAALYQSADKFDAQCGWPSFDDEISGAVKRIPDKDGRRTEITCANCGAHLGHVFSGEGFTDKNVRHCVNSISLNFTPATTGGGSKPMTQIGYFAGGCFWGVEYFFQKENGVSSVKSGYMGGKKEKPTYQEVCSGKTGHIETVEVTFDPAQTSYEKLARLFFEIHDPTQIDRQGPDVGEQYRSVVFYTDSEQKKTAEKLVSLLKDKGLKIATKIEPAGKFWEAEGYHQDYYEKKGGQPYCHGYTKRF